MKSTAHVRPTIYVNMLRSMQKMRLNVSVIQTISIQWILNAFVSFHQTFHQSINQSVTMHFISIPILFWSYNMVHTIWTINSTFHEPWTTIFQDGDRSRYWHIFEILCHVGHNAGHNIYSMVLLIWSIFDIWVMNKI